MAQFVSIVDIYSSPPGRGRFRCELPNGNLEIFSHTKNGLISEQNMKQVIVMEAIYLVTQLLIHTMAV